MAGQEVRAGREVVVEGGRAVGASAGAGAGREGFLSHEAQRYVLDTIVVEQITKNVNRDHLQEIFSTYGTILDIDLAISKTFRNQNGGLAYILYKTTDEAQLAISHMHEAQIDGVKITVSIVLPKRRWSRSPPPKFGYVEREAPRGGAYGGRGRAGRGDRFRSPDRGPRGGGYGGRGGGPPRGGNSYYPSRDGAGVPLDAAAGTTLAAHHIAALLRRDVVVMAGEIVHPEKVEDEEMLVDVVVEDGAGATAAEAGAGHTLVVEAGSVVEEGVRRERVYGLIRSMDIDCSNLGGHLGRQLVLVLLAAGSIPALVLGAPVQYVPLTRIGTVATPDSSFSQQLSERGTSDVYRMYTGTGQSTSWPSMEQWVSTFDEMFTINMKVITTGCTQFNVAVNSAQETSNIATGIKTVATETGIDSRFILAILLQESNGCVRAPTTSYGVRNPGLMQDHDGSATCNEAGRIQNPCPASTIKQMIRDGVAGTPAGDGLVQTMAKAGGYATSTSKYYVSARIYNSGSLAANGDLGAGIATHCYVSDVANRLTGWVYAKKACSLDGGSVDEAYDAPPLPPATARSTAPVIAAEVHEVDPDLIAHEVAHEAPPTNIKAFASKLAPGATTNCAEYYNVQGGDVCQEVSEKFAISLDELRQLNTQIDAGCSNMWMGYDYCVKGL
ncbi:hypothetical protein EG327_005510 [Venturia inaequalis]|uniref:LysM domain-containing protein n=1 Tax=Venturia inaequalis TaxID=5025 RepID=A0A8H3VRS9_VENIN|nr:hypothetical protein EG327_005510 [Venturia inaequalis]